MTDLLATELALDRLAAAVAAELPGHVRALARGEAAFAPPVGSLGVVRDALGHELLAERALAIARTVVPLAIESDPRVAEARTAPVSWDAWTRLADARDRATHELLRGALGHGFVATMHRLFGVRHAPRDVAWPAPVAGWLAGDGVAIDLAAIEARWRALAGREAPGHRARVTFRTGAHARTFVVEPRREVNVVVPHDLDRPAARFLVLHELGHALVAVLAPAGTPRVVDEAAAALVARTIEDPGDPWFSPLAVEARARRTTLAVALDAIEQRASPARPTERPPWAIWHDGGAQAAYAVAESIADRWEAGDLASKIAAERARIDRAP